MPSLPPITDTEWETWQETRGPARQTSSLRDLLLANPPDFSAAPQPSPVRSSPAPSVAGPSASPAPPAPLASGGVNQFGDPELSFAEASAACGPAAAIAFYQRTGRQMTVREATETARQNGLWDAENGMHGPESQQKLLSLLGVPTRLEHGVNWESVQRDVAGGNPVIVDSPGHYWQVLGYRPDDGRYFVSASGTAYRGGSEWMTPEEMTKLAGAPRSALYLDNPLTPAPSHAVTGPVDKSSPDAFIRSVTPYAVQVQAETGIPARIMIGIAANETGYGKSAPGNNFFGIKGANPDTGASFNSPTWEVENGRRVDTTAQFRQYDNPADSFRDFARFLADNPRYAGALQQASDPAAFIKAVHAAGYATDPSWSDKVLSIAGKVPNTPTPPPNLLALTQQAGEQAASVAPIQRPQRSTIPTYTPPAPPAPIVPPTPPELGAASYDQPYTGPSTLDQPSRPEPLSQRTLTGGAVETTYPSMISVVPGTPPPSPTPPPPAPSLPDRIGGFVGAVAGNLGNAAQLLPGVGPVVRNLEQGSQQLRDITPASIATRNLAGEEQIAAESGPEWQALQAALGQYGPEHPASQAAADAYNARTGALRSEGVYNVAERNPSLVPAELATNVAAGTVAGWVAPGAQAGVARNVLGAALDPGTVGMNLAADVARAGQATGTALNPVQREAAIRAAARQAYEESIAQFDDAERAQRAAVAAAEAAQAEEVSQRASREWARPRTWTQQGANLPGPEIPVQLPGEVLGSQRALSAAESPLMLPSARPAPLNEPIAARGAPAGWTPDVIEQGGRPSYPALPAGNPQRVRLEDAARSLEEQAERASHLGDTNQELTLRRQAAATRSAASTTPDPAPVVPRATETGVPPQPVSNLASGAVGALTAGQTGEDQEERSPQEQGLRMAAGFGLGLLGRRVASTVGRTAAREGFAGNVRLAKYPEEVRQIIQSAADANPSMMETARRGTLSDDVVRDLSRYSGIDVERIVKTWKPGQTQNAETLLALREALGSQARVVAQAQEAYRAADTTQNLNQLTEAVMTHASLQEVVSGTTAEAGRALRQFRQSVRGLNTPEDRLDALLKVAYKNGKKEQLEGFLKSVDLNDPVSVANAARTLYNPKLPDLVSWLWYNGLLSNPSGRLRDIISSGIATATYPLETAAAVPFDIVQSRLLGTQRSVYAREAPIEVQAMGGALRKSWSNALEVVAHGFTADQARADLSFVSREPASVDIAGRTLPIPDRVRATVSMPSRITAATDAFFRTMDYDATSAAIAYRRARQEGLSGAKLETRAGELVTDKSTIAEAMTTSRYRVWQEDGKLNRALRSLQNVPGMRLVLPFAQTPVNLTRYVMERSPLGVAMLLGEHAGAATGLTTRPTTRHTAEALGRAAMGSTIMVGLYDLAQQGGVTGPMPENQAERDAWTRQGKQPYSVLLGDQWHDYRAWAMAPLLGSAAAVHQAIEQGHTDNALAIFTAGSLGVTKAMLDQSFMQGLSNFAEAINDPGRRGMALVESMARSVVPQALQVVTRSTDPLIRDPDGPIEAILSTLPGVSDRIGPRRNNFGQAVERPAGQRGLGAISPTRPSGAVSSRLESELTRLQRAEYKVEPGAASKTVSVRGQPVKLTAEQYDKYRQLGGKQAYVLLSQAVNDPRWNGLRDDQQAEFIDNTIRRSREYAKSQLGPELLQAARQQYTEQQQRRRAAGE